MNAISGPNKTDYNRVLNSYTNRNGTYIGELGYKLRVLVSRRLMMVYENTLNMEYLDQLYERVKERESGSKDN